MVFFRVRSWIRRRLYRLGWAILKLGGWAARVGFKADGDTLRGAWLRASQSLENVA